MKSGIAFSRLAARMTSQGSILTIHSNMGTQKRGVNFGNDYEPWGCDGKATKQRRVTREQTPQIHLWSMGKRQSWWRAVSPMTLLPVYPSCLVSGSHGVEWTVDRKPCALRVILWVSAAKYNLPRSIGSTASCDVCAEANVLGESYVIGGLSVAWLKKGRVDARE